MYYAVITLVTSAFLISSLVWATILSGIAVILAVLLAISLCDREPANLRKNIKAAADHHVKYLEDPKNRAQVRLSGFCRVDESTTEYDRHGRFLNGFASNAEGKDDIDYLDSMDAQTTRWVKRYFNHQVKTIQRNQKEKSKNRGKLVAETLNSVTATSGDLDNSIKQHA